MRYFLHFIVLAALLSPAVLAQNTELKPSSVQFPSVSNLNLRSLEEPAGCRLPHERTANLLLRIEKDVASAVKAAAQAFVSDREPGTTEAEAWDTVAAMAALNLDPRGALWCELNALKIEWQPRFVTNAGVYLSYLKLNDDATLCLNCALEMGYRSPYLFEALANLYDRAGDKAKAREYISTAKQAAPGDRLIDAEHSLIHTGKPPTPPRLPDDALERAVLGLHQQHEYVVAMAAQAEKMHRRVNEAEGTPDDGTIVVSAKIKQSFDEWLQSMQPILDDARMTQTQFKRTNPSLPLSAYSQMKALHRNIAFSMLIDGYFAATRELLTWSWQAPTEEGYNVLFWGEVFDLDAVRYARLTEELENYEFNEVHASGVPGNRPSSITEAPFKARFAHADKERAQRHVECMRRYRSGSEQPLYHACIQKVDEEYCGTVRGYYDNWVNQTQGLFVRLSMKADDVGERISAWAGTEVDDAYSYAATYAKEIRARQGDDISQEQVATIITTLNNKYRELVDMAVGRSDEGPASLLRREAELYFGDQRDAEHEQVEYGRTIEQTCQPVDVKMLERMAEERRKAIQSLLLDQLARDLNAQWDPNPDCTFSLGKHFTFNVNLGTGKSSVGGKWDWTKKAFPNFAGSDRNAEVGGGAVGSVNFTKDGEPIGITAGVSGGAGLGPFTGKGAVTMGAQWNEKTGHFDYPVEVSFKPSMGWKNKTKDPREQVGFSCSPGKFSAKFDARVIAKDAMAYVQSLEGSSPRNGGGIQRH